MSELGLEALIERLKEASSDASVQDLLSSLRGAESPFAQEARKRCALVRWFDQDIFKFLCENMTEKPDFGEFTSAPEVQRLSPAKWVVKAGERGRLLAAWQSDTDSWRDWNLKLGDFFRVRQGPDDQLSAVYHLAAGPTPDSLVPLFRLWFSEADQRFDMAHCNALLEMLRLQESWRGPLLSALWREYREYHSARVFFTEDYFKTGSYFERPGVLSSFLSVLERDPATGPWVFHIHASGGLGKSMFTRWLISRYLVPRKIPCSRVDLDDYVLQDVVDFPLKVIRSLVEQWSKQPKGGSLASLLVKLMPEEKQPGWNRSIMQQINLFLKEAGIDSSIVVILDTLEEATLCADDWLDKCLGFLRETKSVLPRLTLILSGRYDISARSSVLRPGEYISYDLPRFSEEEAHRYLDNRSIPPGPVRDAIVARAEADDSPAESRETVIGRNPFKLAIFAELALNREKLTADDVLRFPRADVAYLIERVVKRIQSQPLRWVIRYGAIARHLTPEFAQEVLLPPLLEALRGTNNDQPSSGLSELSDEYRDVWLPDSEAARKLEEKGISDLWDHLSGYARERGWLSWVDATDKSELRFHPEVVNPTRELLRRQEIFSDLQRRAVKFFESKALKEAEADPPRHQAAVRSSCEAVFHRFQLEGIGAESYWIETLRRAEKFGPSISAPIAAEITGREYAEAERIPFEEISSPPLLIRAHCEAADLHLQSDIGDFKIWQQFRHHMELARAIAGKNAYLRTLIPPLLQTIYVAGLRTTAKNKEVAPVLREAMLYAQEIRDRFFLAWQLGKFLVNQGAPEAAQHLREALQLLGDAKRTATSFADVYLKLADLYEFQGIHTAVIEALRAARKSTGRANIRALVMHREAGYYLKVGDIGSAEKRLAGINGLNQQSPDARLSADVLEARIATSRLDPFAALRSVVRPDEETLSARNRARCLDQEGEARALLFEFETALERWNLAASSYDQARDPVGSARCGLLASALAAKGIGDFDVAETHVLSALSLSGSQDAEINAELNILYAFIHLRLGRLNEAAERAQNVCVREDLPDHIRARALIFSLIFGLDSGDELLRSIEECMSEVQPVSLRDSLLDWAEYSTTTVSVPQEFVRRLMEQMSRPAFESTRGSGMLIGRAHLYRVLGMSAESEAELARVDDTNLLVGWRHCLARESLGLHAGYGALLERFVKSDFAATPLCAALRVAAAWEAVGGQDFAKAQSIFDGNPPEPAGLPLRWKERLNQLVTQLLTTSTRDLAVLPTLKFKAHRVSAFIPEETVVLTEADIPNEWRSATASSDEALQLFFGVIPGLWQGLGNAMEAVLDGKNAHGKAVEFIGRTGMLPWELGGAWCRRSSKAVQSDFAPLPTPQFGAVLVLLPGESASEISSTSDSGFSIEQVYQSYGFSPQTLPVFDDLPTLANTPPPVVIHIVAAIREATNGVYLDFSTSEHRAQSFGQAASGISLTAFRLDRMLAAFPTPPFVILDPGLPYNRTEAVYTLLRRNTFATQLFELGHVRGVFAGGLANSYERFLLTSRYVAALLRGNVIDALDALRSDVPDHPQRLSTFSDQDFEFVLARLGAALWTNAPQDRLFLA